ncbi:hypothetical protein BDK51DRAFT_30998, partial [Blyttiomyces helicus]
MPDEVGGERFKVEPPPPTKRIANVLNRGVRGWLDQRKEIGGVFQIISGAHDEKSRCRDHERGDFAYGSGPQLFSEIIQNSDDAGAKKQVFCLDKRTFRREHLLHEKLEAFNRGVHLIAFNDALFEDKDFMSLLSFGNSQKQKETESIGKFGLGFTSIYHICDELSFLSGDYVAFLDPHARILTNEGSKFNIIDKRVDAEAPDQLAPFHAYDSSLKLQDWTGKRFPGTLFRYRLRSTPEQAELSEISKDIYDNTLICEFFEKFHSVAHETLLFLQSLSEITFYVWDEGETAPHKLFSTRIINADDLNRSVIRASLRKTLASAEEKLIQEKPELLALFPGRSAAGTRKVQFETSAEYELKIEQCDFRAGADRREVSTWLVYQSLWDVAETQRRFLPKGLILSKE